jgi:hypothetical protein
VEIDVRDGALAFDYAPPADTPRIPVDEAATDDD